MIILDYFKYVAHLSPKVTLPERQLMYTLGLYTEFAEYYEVMVNNTNKTKMLDELGDVVWYLSGLTTIHGYDSLGVDIIEQDKVFYDSREMARKITPTLVNNFILRDLPLVAEKIKKSVFHKRAECKVTEKEIYSLWLGLMNVIPYDDGLSIQKAINANVRKLDKRFPQGYVDGGGNR